MTRMKIAILGISQSQTRRYQRVIQVILEIYFIELHISCVCDAMDLPVQIENI